MEPISVWVRRGGDWAVLHQCRKCGVIHSNRIAGDDNEIALVGLAVRAISQPPFPLERLNITPEPTDENWPHLVTRVPEPHQFENR